MAHHLSPIPTKGLVRDIYLIVLELHREGNLFVSPEMVKKLWVEKIEGLGCLVPNENDSLLLARVHGALNAGMQHGYFVKKGAKEFSRFRVNTLGNYEEHLRKRKKNLITRPKKQNIFSRAISWLSRG